MSKETSLYCNNTGENITVQHNVIVRAIENGGEFDEDFADVFKLTKTPEGSACLWTLDFI